jgi:hypothetical protein
MGKMRHLYRDLVRKDNAKKPPKRICWDNIKIHLEQGRNGGIWAGFIWLMISTTTGCSEYGNEAAVSIKGGESLDQLNDDELLIDEYYPGSSLLVLLLYLSATDT